MTLLTNATGGQARDHRRGQRRSRTWWSSATGEHRAITQAPSWSLGLRRRKHGQAAPSLGERQASGRPRQRLGSGRAQLHVPRKPGGARPLARGEPDHLPEDARAQRLLLRQRRLRVPTREHPDDRQVTGARCSAARSRRRRSSHPNGRWSGSPRHAIDFWLSTEDLPRPENRVTLDSDGNLTLRYTPTNDVPKQRLNAKLKSILGKLRHEPRPPDPPLRLHEERDSAGGLSRIRPGHAGSGRIRPRRR